MATYFIRQGGHGAQGPFDEARIAGYIAAGRVRPGMEVSPDGQRWMPVEEHRLFARAARPVTQTATVAVCPVEVAEDVEKVAEDDAPAPRRPTRRSTPAPRSGGGVQGAMVVVGILFVGAIASMASKGGGSSRNASDHRVGSDTRDAGSHVSDSLVGTWSISGGNRSGADWRITFRDDCSWSWYHRTTTGWQLDASGTWTSRPQTFGDSGKPFEEVATTDKQGSRQKWARNGMALSRLFYKQEEFTWKRDPDMEFRKNSDGTESP